ncbi:MAG: hypothetical protein ACKODN_01305, partial [Actinomycetota bacterium]
MSDRDAMLAWLATDDSVVAVRRLAQCLSAGMRIQIEGNGFRPDEGAPGVYMATWADFSMPIPRTQLVPVAARVDSVTRITAEVPALDRFPTPPNRGAPITIVLVS